MDAKQFLAEFGHIANAPGGVVQLRELILQLAISGKLVEPSSEDCSVTENILAAKKWREKYEADLNLRSNKQYLPIDSKPFSIPKHWAWERLERLTLYIQRGKSPKYSAAGSTYVISQKCIQRSGFDLTPARFIDDNSLNTYGPERFLKTGDLLWNSTGTGTAGRIAIYDQAKHVSAVTDSHVTVIRLANFLPRFIWCVIASPWVQIRIEPSHLDSLVSGTTQQVELSTGTVRALPIPCPPIEEQARIVAKVDELMVLCDKLETQQQQRRNLQNHLAQANLQALAEAKSSEEITKSWLRVQNSLPLWGREPQAIRDLRNVIGALACRGLLAKGTEFKMDSETDAFLPALPIGWEWGTLGNLSEYITSGSRGWKAYIASEGDAFIRSQDIKQDALIFENPAFVSLPEKVEGMRSLVKQGDLLLTITGGNVGKCARVPALDFNAYVSQHVALIRIKKPEQSEFIHFWMTNSYGGRKFLSRYIYGDKPGLNLSQVASVPVPLPPPDIKEEIIRQLKHYGAYCDQLLEKIENSSKIVEAFAAASVSVITSIHTEE